jgi:two-component system chemotaxis sensor kinase CheA
MLPPRHWPIVGALTHGVRNAVDHDVEAPDARGAKPSCAEVRVAFARKDGAIRCMVTDDGRGIDSQRLLERAASAGMITAEEASTLSHESALALLLADGLSASEQVSESCGRGVGMILSIGWAVLYASIPNPGSALLSSSTWPG